MENDRLHYDVFISYSRRDYKDSKGNVIQGNIISKIKDELKKAGVNYWIDEEGIRAGDEFVESIATYIEKSDIFLFVSSKNSICNSEWTPQEISYASNLDKPIIPFKIDETPYNKCNRKKVAFQLAHRDYIEYYNNPKEKMKTLVKTIKSMLHELEEKRKNEDERLRREKEEKKELERIHAEEQERLISEIRGECEAINKEEIAVEDKREQLLLKAKDITDARNRDNLELFIKTTSPIQKSNQKVIDGLKLQVMDLERNFKAKEAENNQLITHIQEQEAIIADLKKYKDNIARYNALKWLLYGLFFALTIVLFWFII